MKARTRLDQITCFLASLAAASTLLLLGIGPCFGQPSFDTQPESQGVIPGADVTFSAAAWSSSAISYQWQLNGADIPGANNNALRLENVTHAQAGAYTLVATDPDGSTTSDPADLFFLPVGFFTDVKNLGSGVNTGLDDHAFAITTDGLTIYVGRFDWDYESPLEEQDGDIFVATRTSTENLFGNAVSIQTMAQPGVDINTDFFEYPTHISKDGLILYFTSNRSGDFGLYQATRTQQDGPFEEVLALGPTLRELSDISADGLTAYFWRATQPGDTPNYDIFVARRDSVDQPFGEAVPLPGPVNEDFDECYPAISADGLVLFFSDYALGSDGNPKRDGEGQSIYVTARASTESEFNSPISIDAFSLGSMLSGDWQGSPYISPDWPAPGSKLYFARWRSGGPRYDVYQATWIPFQMKDVAVGGDVAEITFGTKPGVKYQLQYRDELEGAGWIDVGVVITAASTAELITDDQVSQSGQRFYRLIMVE